MLGRQLGFSTFAFLLTFVLNLVKVKYLANILSTEDYGIYTLFFNTVSFASFFLLFGLDRFLTTQAAVVDDSDAAKLLGTLCTFFLLITFAVSPLAFLLPNDNFVKINLIIGVILFGLGNLFRFFLLARRRVTTYNIVNLIILHVWLIGLPFVNLVTKVSLPAVFSLMNLGFLIAVLASIYCIIQDNKHFRLTFDWANVYKGLAFALPLIPVVLATKFLQVGDRYFLLAFDGPNAVALYSLATSIIGIVVAMLTVISDTVRPYILREGLSETGKRMISGGFGVSLIVILGVAPGIYFFGEAALVLLANSDYAEASNLFPWLLPVLFSQLFIPIATTILEKNSETRKIGFAYILSFSIFIITNLLLGPSLKSIGCALSYSISTVALAGMLAFFSRIHRAFTGMPFATTFFSGITLSLLAYLLDRVFGNHLLAPTIFMLFACPVIFVLGKPYVVRIKKQV